MRALVQRVNHASVTNEDEIPSFPSADGLPLRNSIGKGYVVFLGVGREDGVKEADKLWGKLSKLRIFEDESGKTNLSLKDVGGEILLVSQFTLYANCRKGNRPSFTQAGAPDVAKELYEYFARLIAEDKVPVKTGWFGAMMKVELENDGPFTIWLDTDTL